MNDEHDDCEVRSIIVEYDDEPDECTFYRADADGDRWTTEWISAKEGTYIDLQAELSASRDTRDEQPMGGDLR